MFFYPIFDHHIYTGQIQYILGQNLLCYIISSLSLSLIKMQNGEYFSLYFFAMMLYNNALNMHAGIGVDLRDCFAKRSTIRFLSHLHDK